MAHKCQTRLGVWWFKRETRSILELVELFPRWVKIVVFGCIIFLYTLARLYMLVEGFVGLRSLPAEVFTTVE